MTGFVTSPGSQHPALLLHDSYRLLRRCLRQQFSDLGLSEPQWRVLSTVNRLPGISQTRLANLLGIGKAPLGALVDRLEAEGLLTRTTDPGDRRANCLQVTPQAEPTVLQLRQRYQAIEPAFFEGLSDAEQEQARRALVQLYTFLASQDPRSDAVPLDELPLIMVLTGVYRLSARLFDSHLKQLGFTRSQWLVLDAVSRAEGLPQRKLASRLNMTKATLGNLVDHLTDGGWVERRTHPQDRRCRQLYLTASCRDQLHTLVADYEQRMNRALYGIDDAQRDLLRHTLSTLRHNLGRVSNDNEVPDLEMSQ